MIFQVIGGVVFSLIGLGSIIFCRQITRLYIFLLEQLGGSPGYWYAGKMRPVRFLVTGVFFLVIGLVTLGLLVVIPR